MNDDDARTIIRLLNESLDGQRKLLAIAEDGREITQESRKLALEAHGWAREQNALAKDAYDRGKATDQRNLETHQRNLETHQRNLDALERAKATSDRNDAFVKFARFTNKIAIFGLLVLAAILAYLFWRLMFAETHY